MVCMPSQFWQLDLITLSLSTHHILSHLRLFGFFSLLLLDAHGHDTGSHAAHGPEGNISNTSKDVEAVPSEMTSAKTEVHQHPHMILDSVISQVIGVAILEFGVVLHR